jgi:hypothetical protein
MMIVSQGLLLYFYSFSLPNLTTNIFFSINSLINPPGLDTRWSPLPPLARDHGDGHLE